jgi:hypothetical protein
MKRGHVSYVVPLRRGRFTSRVVYSSEYGSVFGDTDIQQINNDKAWYTLWVA